MAARQSDLRLYLDVIPEGSKPELPLGSIMVFMKHFDTSKQTLYGIGKSYVPRNSKVSDLFPIINERMRWTPGTPLKLYEVGLCFEILFRQDLNHVIRKSNLA